MPAGFTSSGWEGSGLPTMTLDSIREGGDPRVLGWVREAVIEGDRINRADPGYDVIETGQMYISGFQAKDGDSAKRPGYLPGITLNSFQEVTQAHVSALTDLKPLFSYRATNPAFTQQAELQNKLTIASWIATKQDIALADTVKYTLTGCGDMTVEWNPRLGPFGDIQWTARDPRDTLPIRPPTHQREIQSWDGMVIREAHTVNALAGLWPAHAHLFKPTTDSLLSTLMGRIRTFGARLISPAADTLAGLNQPAVASRIRSGDLLLYRVFINDRTRNLSGHDIPMGIPGSASAYVVPHGEYLYPFKRMFVCTPEAMLYDGPSVYWHGQFPITRLKIRSLPWESLGGGLFRDLAPLQDGINDFAQDIMLSIKQWTNPQVKYNRNAVPESFMRTYDPRRPGGKVKLNEVGVEQGFVKLEGPPAQVIALALQTLQYLQDQFNRKSGTPNLQELLALRGSSPSAETIERYWEAVTPEIRQEGRAVESFLSDVAEQMKFLRMQYESQAHRVQILGQQEGQVLEDFDFDPEVLVPSLQQGDAGWTPDLDKDRPRHLRIQAFAKAMVFVVAPNSLLAMNATERKMIAMQNFRMGALDFWSYHETLETPNIGQPPAIPLPPINPQKVQEEVQAALMDPTGQAFPMLMASGKYTLDPATGQMLEIRVPTTITERLLAQNMLGIGTTGSPASGEGPPGGSSGPSGGGPGRKASGQAPPKMEQKSDGRTTVTESRKD